MHRYAPFRGREGNDEKSKAYTITDKADDGTEEDAREVLTANVQAKDEIEWTSDQSFQHGDLQRISE